MEWTKLENLPIVVKNKKIFDNLVSFAKSKNLDIVPFLETILKDKNYELMEEMFNSQYFTLYADTTKRKVITILKAIASIHEPYEGFSKEFSKLLKGDFWVKKDITIENPPFEENEELIEENNSNVLFCINNLNTIHKLTLAHINKPYLLCRYNDLYRGFVDLLTFYKRDENKE